MDIRESSKKIVRYLLEEAVKSGDLSHQAYVDDSKITKEQRQKFNHFKKRGQPPRFNASCKRN